jgi:hypothetical protein
VNYFVFKVWTTNVSRQVMIGWSGSKSSKVRLPSGDGNTSAINIIVEIQDSFGCVTQYDKLPPVVVVPNKEDIETLIKDSFVNSTSIEVNNGNSVIESLASADETIVEQLLTSFSQVINDMNKEILEIGAASKRI